MENRHVPEKFHASELISADDFEQRLEAVEHGLRLQKNRLRHALLPPENLAELKKELATTFAAIYDPLNVAVIDITDNSDEDPETAALIAKKNLALKADLNTIFDYLQHQKDAHIAAQLAEVEAVRQKIIRLDGCYAGNHALTLDVFKRNIAIALQQAAHQFYENHEATRKTPAQFNLIFNSISNINEHGVIYHYEHALDQYADFSLVELQKNLTEILSDCTRAKELGILNEIKASLKSLNHLAGHDLTANKTLVEIHHDNVHFTKDIHDVEEKALLAASSARKLLRDLETSAHNKIDAFDDDKTFITKRKLLREAILQADHEIDVCRENVAKRRDGQLAAKSYGFWERHPVFKSACIGALIALGIIGLGALMTGFIFLTAGAAAAPIGAFFAMLAAKVGVGGTVGLGIAASVPVIGVGALIGKLGGDAAQSKNQYQILEMSPSTTKRLLPEMQRHEPRFAYSTPQQNLTSDASEENHALLSGNASLVSAANDDQSISLRRRK